MLRYGPFEPRLWKAIGELYRHAEAGGFTDTAITIYPATPGSGSGKHEYLKIMMLWGGSADVLPQVKQDIADRAITHFLGSFKPEKAPFPDALYWFDNDGDRPPARLLGNAPTGTDVHYFAPGDV